MAVLLITLMSMSIGCGAATGEVTRPEVEADEVRTFLRDSCEPAQDRPGYWICDAAALDKVGHALVDLKWDLVECEEGGEYTKQVCLIKIEKLHAKLSECKHDPWCIGPIMGSVSIVVGFLLGLLAF